MPWEKLIKTPALSRAFSADICVVMGSWGDASGLL
jgi:hypothetical protein